MLDHGIEKIDKGFVRIYCRKLGKTFRQVGEVEKQIDVLGEGPLKDIAEAKQGIADLSKAINERDKFDLIIAKKLKEQDEFNKKLREGLSHLNKKIEMLKK